MTMIDTEHLGNLMRTGPPSPSVGCLLAVPGHTPLKAVMVDGGLLAVQLQGSEQHNLGHRRFSNPGQAY